MFCIHSRQNKVNCSQFKIDLAINWRSLSGGTNSSLICFSFSNKAGPFRKMAENPDYTTATAIHEFTVKNIKGEDVKLDVYKGHVCIVVNVASQCGLTTSNYKSLNELYEQYAETKGELIRIYIARFLCSLVLYCESPVVGYSIRLKTLTTHDMFLNVTYLKMCVHIKKEQYINM